MLSVIVAPTKLATGEYCELSTVEVIHPLRLLTIEDRLEKLLKLGCKGIKDIGNIVCTKELIEKQVKAYKLRPEKYPMTSFQDLLDYIENSLFDIKKKLSILINNTNELKVMMAENVSELEDGIVKEQFIFVDCIYCIVDPNVKAKFEKCFDNRVIVFIKKINNKSMYKIFCLKKEREEVKKALKKLFNSTEVDFVDLNNEQPLLSPEDANKEDKNVEMMRENEKEVHELLYLCVELTISVAIFRGFVEVLNKYGFPPDFKYKLLRNSEVEKEIKILRSISKGKEIEDMIAIIEISL
ncbi:hypothetical protein GINT2_000692 [Glugoides intestinalis]